MTYMYLNYWFIHTYYKTNDTHLKILFGEHGIPRLAYSQKMAQHSDKKKELLYVSDNVQVLGLCSW